MTASNELPGKSKQCISPGAFQARPGTLRVTHDIYTLPATASVCILFDAKITKAREKPLSIVLQLIDITIEEELSAK